jgi:hypothetical protein
MGIASTVAALQAIHATVSGVTSAPTARPVDVALASLPCIIVRPGALTLSRDGRRLAGRVRQYEGVALVTAPNQGRGIAEGLAKTQSLMDAFAATYEAQIESGADLSTGGVIVGYRDGGEPQSLIGYGASDFEGFTFTVEVWEG